MSFLHHATARIPRRLGVTSPAAKAGMASMYGEILAHWRKPGTQTGDQPRRLS